jgi:hypothetical protein
MTRQLKVLYVLYHYPQMSETYIKVELDAICGNCDVSIVAVAEADLAYSPHRPFTLCSNEESAFAVARQIAPDVLHTHWLVQVPLVASLAASLSRVSQRPVYFTVRAHSFDVLSGNGKHVRAVAEHLNSDHCLGVLSFPFAREAFLAAGVDNRKIVDCRPVVDFSLFHDRSPNGDGIMNVGACLPKKRMQDFIRLAQLMPDRKFTLYPIGYKRDELTAINKEAGSPVAIAEHCSHEAMAREYKKHRWLVYTAETNPATIGWPISVAEAQAAGLGICIPKVRPDISEYIGPAGFTYACIEEVIDIVSTDYPEHLREVGFSTAQLSDIHHHKDKLLRLWAGRVISPA